MIIVDAHQDLAWNMLNFGRDYSRSASETRRLEAGSQTPSINGDTLLGWPDYIRGEVALIFCSIFACPERLRRGAWERQFYSNTSAAQRVYSAQIDAYRRLFSEHPDKFQPVTRLEDLQTLQSSWQKYQERTALFSESKIEKPSCPAVGLLISMEGAEAVGAPSELESWWEKGVRIIGPAWAGTRFCGGTHEPGPMTKEGFALLEVMADFGFGLDLSHMDERACLQALDAYPGPVLASHSNVQALLKGSDSNRYLSDQLISNLTERGGVIGVMPYNVFIKPGWKKGDSRHEVSLLHLVAHIDHICQITGTARHVALGSDFDGGFGLQSAPLEIDTIADLQMLTPLLAERGYSHKEITGVLGLNWLNWLKKVLPAD